MCEGSKPDPGRGAVRYDRVEDLLAALRPGMDLCTSDCTGWADIVEIRPEDAVIVGRTREGNRLVQVPAGVVIGVHHDQCVRIDRARATVDQQGWEVVGTEVVDA